MTLKDVRSELYGQMKLVKEDASGIPQAESIANLTGKAIKAIDLEIRIEFMREQGHKFRIFEEVL